MAIRKKLSKKIIKESTTNNQKRKTLENPRISLPYIKGTIDKIARILTKHNIMVAFTLPNTIKNMLDSAPKKITKEFTQFLVHVAKYI